jgi:hypothetical protein
MKCYFNLVLILITIFLLNKNICYQVEFDAAKLEEMVTEHGIVNIEIDNKEALQIESNIKLISNLLTKYSTHTEKEEIGLEIAPGQPEIKSKASLQPKEPTPAESKDNPDKAIKDTKAESKFKKFAQIQSPVSNNPEANLQSKTDKQVLVKPKVTYYIPFNNIRNVEYLTTDPKINFKTNNKKFIFKEQENMINGNFKVIGIQISLVSHHYHHPIQIKNKYLEDSANLLSDDKIKQNHYRAIHREIQIFAAYNYIEENMLKAYPFK